MIVKDQKMMRGESNSSSAALTLDTKIKAMFNGITNGACTTRVCAFKLRS